MSIAADATGEAPVSAQMKGLAGARKPPPKRTAMAKPDAAIEPEPR